MYQKLLNPIIPFTYGWILIQIKERDYVFQPANSYHCPIDFMYSDMKSHTATIISITIDTTLILDQSIWISQSDSHLTVAGF